LFETAGRFSTNHTSGTATYNTTGVLLDSTSTANRVAEIYIAGLSNDNWFAGSPEFSCMFRPSTLGTTGTIWLIVGEKDNTDHFGFKITISGSTATLYATQANGSSETVSSALTTIGGSDIVEVCAKKNSTSSIDYYWRINNGSWSSATNLTATMPTNSNTGMVLFHVNNSNQSTQQAWNFRFFSYMKY